jgi:hypothetical protein
VPEESGHQKGYIVNLETDDPIRDRNASLRRNRTAACLRSALSLAPRKARRTALTIPVADQST